MNKCLKCKYWDLYIDEYLIDHNIPISKKQQAIKPENCSTYLCGNQLHFNKVNVCPIVKRKYE